MKSALSSLTIGLGPLSDIDHILDKIRSFSSKDSRPNPAAAGKVWSGDDYRNIVNREIQLRVQAVDALSALDRKNQSEISVLRHDLAQIQQDLKQAQAKKMEADERNQSLKRRVEALESDLRHLKQKSHAESALLKRATFYAVRCAGLLKTVSRKLTRARVRLKCALDVHSEHKQRSRDEIDELKRREHRQSKYIMLLEARLRSASFGENYGQHL